MRRFLFLGFVLIGLSAVAQQVLVPPYVQPGNASNLSQEMKVIVWQTDNIAGDYTVVYAPGPSVDVPHATKARVTSQTLDFLGRTTMIHRAYLNDLAFDTTYTYRVTVGTRVVGTASFQSRTKRPVVRFATFGDVGTASPQQKAIAYQVYLSKPQFVLITGDLAYNNGTEREFRARFFPPYMAYKATSALGGPLMQSVPFYLSSGNHDVTGSDLGSFPDGMALYYYADVPMNAPLTALTTEITGPRARVQAFMRATEGRFPKMNNYSFDQGNVHITVLDANSYVDPLDNTLVEWMRKDIGSSTADWKIVAHHHPGFNSSLSHYEYQQMRLLSPLMEELGVDLAITSHVHNYQRSKPLRFAPKKNKSGAYAVSIGGRVDGAFTLDEQFNGTTQTKANGIIYIVSGGGGAALYDTPQSNKPETWRHGPTANWVPFTVKLISDKHSFTLVETNGKTLTLKQIDLNGHLLDEIKMTK